MATKTRKFGSSSRESHDAGAYYARRMSGGKAGEAGGAAVPAVESAFRNRIVNRSSESMSELPDNSVALMITSPPYNVGKEYDNDLTLEDYLQLLRSVFRETHRVLEPGGRACINLANVGRRPYISLTTHVAGLMNGLGFFQRGEIIWKKASGANGSCAWGSFRSAYNPTLRDIHEYILVYSKGQFERARRGESTIPKEEFMRDTLSIWEIPPESARKTGHPAPFPVELPKRLINLLSFKGDLILDPFAGSGSTCVAARDLGRDYVGYDIDRGYCDLALRRLGAPTS